MHIRVADDVGKPLTRPELASIAEKSRKGPQLPLHRASLGRQAFPHAQLRINLLSQRVEAFRPIVRPVEQGIRDPPDELPDRDVSAVPIVPLDGRSKDVAVFYSGLMAHHEVHSTQTDLIAVLLMLMSMRRCKRLANAIS